MPAPWPPSFCGFIPRHGKSRSLIKPRLLQTGGKKGKASVKAVKQLFFTEEPYQFHGG